MLGAGRCFVGDGHAATTFGFRVVFFGRSSELNVFQPLWDCDLWRKLVHTWERFNILIIHRHSMVKHFAFAQQLLSIALLIQSADRSSSVKAWRQRLEAARGSRQQSERPRWRNGMTWAAAIYRCWWLYRGYTIQDTGDLHYPIYDMLWYGDETHLPAILVAGFWRSHILSKIGCFPAGGMIKNI